MRTRKFTKVIIGATIILSIATLPVTGYAQSRVPSTQLTAAESRDKKEIAQSPWHGCTWNVMGDSMTVDGQYAKTIDSVIGFKQVNNYGIAGTCITAADENDSLAMSIRCGEMDGKAELVSIFGGTNDWGSNKPLGDMDSTSVTTFYGALKHMFDTILEKNPKARIFIMTPIQRNKNSLLKEGPGDDAKTNALGLSLKEYVDAIKEVAEAYSVPVLDLYGNSGICVKNIDTFTVDGLHPNEEGYQRIARQIIGLLDSL